MSNPTFKQRLLIAQMEHAYGIKFKGSTSKEASAFISRYSKDYSQYKQYERETNDYFNH